jgi:hypothetical protein
MGSALESATVAFLAAGEGTEQAELVKPWQAVLIPPCGPRPTRRDQAQPLRMKIF